jgi:hypothetical protein
MKKTILILFTLHFSLFTSAQGWQPLLGELDSFVTQRPSRFLKP